MCARARRVQRLEFVPRGGQWGHQGEEAGRTDLLQDASKRVVDVRARWLKDEDLFVKTHNLLHWRVLHLNPGGAEGWMGLKASKV